MKLGDEPERLRATIRKLHYPYTDPNMAISWCEHCGHEWPCPTIAAADERKP